MKNLKSIISASFLLAGLVSWAQTEGPTFKSWSIGVQGVHLYDLPATRFDGKLSQDLQGLNGDKTSFDVGLDVYVEKMFTPLFGMQLGGRFGNMTGANDVEYYTNSFYEVQLDGLFYLSNIDALHTNSRWNYFVSAGIGNGSFEAEQFLIADDSQDNQLEDSYWSTRVGAGVQYELNSYLRLELEAGYNWVRTDGFDGFDNGSGSDNYLATGLGIAYTFGKKDNSPMYATNYFDGDYIPMGAAGATEDAASNDALNALKEQLETQQAQLAALEQENVKQKEQIDALSNKKPAKPTDLGKVIKTATPAMASNTEVYFAFDSAFLTNSAKRELSRALLKMENKANAKIELVAYADKNGDDAYNKLLKTRRANAVKTFLVQIGFNHANINSRMGEANPMEYENQFLNRKVEVLVK